MTAYFITAIGTEIGKTYVGAALLRAWSENGYPVSACKPLMSGFAENALPASDAGQLLQAMGQPVTPETVSGICLHRFEAPLAPNVAMQRAGMVQDYDAILGFARKSLPEAADQMHIVEGAGGLMSPVTDTRLHIDMIEALGLPVILVASDYLGSVSHTLTALSCLAARNIKVAAMAVSQPGPEAGNPSHLVGEVRRWSDIPAFTLAYQEKATELADYLRNPIAS